MKRFVLVVFALMACGPQQASIGSGNDLKSSSGAALADKVLLTFPPDFSVQQDSPITAGATVHVNYDVSRLSQCRGDFNGQPAWTITGHWQLDSDASGTWDAGGFGFGTPVNGNEFVVPHAGNLQLWFEISDRWGCHGWDSKYGANYQFNVSGKPPVIHFNSDWSSSVEGSLKGAQVIGVDYDAARLPQCRSSYMGWQTWAITANWNFDGGTGHSAPVTGYDHQTVVPQLALISVDPGATTLSLWFHGSDVTDCSSWDSAYGQNYTFGLQ
jgi:hypothetical protein